MYIPLPDDFHAHLRQGDFMPLYVQDLAKQFGRAIIMPNTVPAMVNANAIAKYKADIIKAAAYVRKDFTPLMTFKLNANYTEQDIKDMLLVGVVAGKYYPAGVTTNSQDGVSDFESIFKVVHIMEKLGVTLCVHGEEPGEFCLDRENAFINRIKILSKEFPKLKIVFEHLSSAKSVEAVMELPKNVAATITVHHLIMTLDDIIGDSLHPHNFCKPLPKRPEDKKAIREAAFSGNPKFFLGTDSAPHQMSKKECPCGAAGVYSAPVAIPILIQEFKNAGHLDKLANFVAGFGADFYELSRTTQQLKITEEKWTVPAIVNGVVPLAAGKVLDYKVG